MLALLGTMFGSIFSGGATGLLGIVFQRYFDFKNKQQDIEVIKLNLQNAIDLKRIEIEQTAKEWEGRAHVATVEGEAKISVAEQEKIGETAICPKCGIQDFELLSGKEFFIKEIVAY